MKDERKTQIRVGVSVILAFIVLTWVFSWAKNVDFFSDAKILQIKFNSVAGLEAGDAVTISGVRKGHVDGINIDSSGVLVHVKFDSDVNLKSDAEFSIMMLDLMGGKKIEIYPGSDKSELDFSLVQNGKFAGDIATAMGTLSSVQYDLVDVIKEVKVSLKNLNRLVEEGSLEADIKNSMSNFNTLTRNLNLLVTENREAMRTLLQNGNEFTALSRDILDENRDNIKLSLDEIKTLSKASTEMVDQMNSFLLETSRQENNLGKFLYDEQIFNDLTATLNQAKELTSLLMEQLKGEGLNVDANIGIR